MRNTWWWALTIGLSCAAGAASAAPPAASPVPDAEVARRVEALLARMTLEEKVGQLTQVAGGLFPGAKPEEALRKGGAGSILWLNDTKKFNELQRIAVEESRLKIPVLFGLDVIHGYRTIFPVPLAMAASWDPAVHERAAAVAAREARAAGIHWTFAPMVDVARDARWGRIVEGAGEDPYLGAAMAAAQVRGFQGPYLGSPGRVLACAKHFAAYGASEGGRDYDPVYVPEGQLRNVFFPPFHAAVAAGVGSFMSAYMDLNDVPAAGNRWLLRDVLKGEWGFPGFVVSDAMGVGNLVTMGFARDRADAARRAVAAGLDMEMASGTFPEHLARLVSEGAVPLAQVDDAVRRVLAVKVRLGLFESPYADESKVASVLADPAHREEARRAAQRSMVLLRNEKKLLPLAKTVSSLAVIGPLADSKADTEGSWTVFGHVPAAVTVLEGLRAKVPGARIVHAPGPEIRRQVPSFFDDFAPGPKPKPQTPEDGGGRLPAGGRDRPRRRRRDRGDGRAREHERGGGLARVARPAGPAGGAAEGAGRPRQARGARAPERPAAEHQLGGRERARHSRGVGAGDGGWKRGGRRPLRGRQPRGQAAGHLPALGRPRAALLRPEPHALARGRARCTTCATGTGPRRRSTPSATGSATRPSRSPT